MRNELGHWTVSKSITSGATAYLVAEALQASLSQQFSGIVLLVFGTVAVSIAALVTWVAVSWIAAKARTRR